MRLRPAGQPSRRGRHWPCRDDQGSPHLRWAGHTAEKQGSRNLIAQQIEDMTDPGLAADRESPLDWTANQDGTRTERQRFQHVGPPPDAAIEQDLGAAGGCLDDRGQSLE